MLKLLFIFIPITFVLEWSHSDPTYVFVCACLSIIPLAGLMGTATEHLSEHVGEGIGGFLNATFGNAAELIIAIFAMKEGLHEVVKASITGSILGNILMVLGLSIFVGGIKFDKQKFNKTAVSLSSTLLFLGVVALVIPAIFEMTSTNKSPLVTQNLSLMISVILFFTYIVSLIFSLKTHKHLYVGEYYGVEGETETHESWSKNKSIFTLIGATIAVALMSEVLVGAIEHTSKVWGLSEVFVGVILVAIIGNAAEHSTAIMVARKNKMDLAIHIAVGASLQIVLFVAPVLVFCSYLFAHPMNLVFTPMEVVATFVSVIAVNMVISDGETNWMEGVMLLAVYAILGITFYYL